MADYAVNSDTSIALRKSEVVALEKMQLDGQFVLIAKTSARPMDITVETDATQAGLDTKAATFLAALEAA